MNRSTALVLFAFAACAPIERVPIDGRPKAVIVAVEDPSGALEVHAFDGSAVSMHTTLLLDRRSDFDLTVLSYNAPLDALRIAPGRVAAAPPNAPSRPLPPFDGARRTTVQGGIEGPWNDVDSLDGALARFRLVELSPAECAARGGCSTGAIDPPSYTCSLPCPDPDPPMPPAAPRPPKAPSPPCPDGWAPITDEGLDACAPPSPPARLSCPDGLAQFYRESTCRTVGPPCGADPWAADLPIGVPILYVQSGAPAGGDGSQSAPYPTIDLAIASAPSPSVIAIARGRYAETIALRDGIALWGACASDTVLMPMSTDSPVIGISGGRAEIHRVTIAQASAALVVDTGTIALSEAIIRRDATQLTVIRGGTLTASTVLLQGTGRIAVDLGGILDAHRLVFDRIVGRGILVHGTGSRVRLADAVFWGDTSTIAGPIFADGPVDVEIDRVLVAGMSLPIEAHDGASLSVTDAAFSSCPNPIQITSGEAHIARTSIDGAYQGIGACHCAIGPCACPGIALTIEDTIVRNSSTAVGFASGSKLVVHRAFLPDTHGMGISAHDADGVDISDLVIRSAAGPPPLGPAVKIGGNVGALKLSRIHVARWNGPAIEIAGAGSATVSDVLVEDVSSSPNDQGGGIAVSTTLRLLVDAAAFDGITGVPLLVVDKQLMTATIAISNVRITNTTAVGTRDKSMSAGAAVHVENNTARIDRIAISGTHGQAIQVVGTFGVAGTARVAAEDVAIDGFDLEAISVANGGALSIARLSIANGTNMQTSSGVMLANAATLSGIDVLIDRPGVSGLAADASSASLERFIVRGSLEIGVDVADGAHVELHDGEVTGNPVGARVLKSGLDPLLLLDRVRFTGDTAAIE